MKRMIILYLILNLILTACSSTTATPNQGSTANTPQPARSNDTLPTANTTSPTPQITDTPSASQPDAYFLPDPAVGLDQMSSYRSTLTISFKGKGAGQPADWQDVQTRIFSQEAATQFSTLTTRDENDQPLQLMHGAVGAARYYQKGSEACQVSWDDRAASGDDIDLAAMLPPIARAKEVDQETVNGVPCRHYSIAEESNGVQSTGELWLAEPGGYVVKYDLSIQAGEQFFGTGNEGVQTFQYELSDINTLQDVPLPAGCPTVLTEIPALPDAIDLVRLPGSMSFTTPSSLEAVDAFYRDTLQAQGWELLAQHADDVEQPVLIFTRKEGAESVLISLQQEAEGVWVAIQLSEPDTTPGT